MNELNCCRLCPRECGADRSGGKYGFCGAGSNLRIARAALHFWEEPCISGKEGSGTVFFSGCTMRCVYCQNYEVSTNCMGYEITIDELAEIFLDLQKKGANNINLVTPTQYVPQITAALDIAKKGGLTLPIVYNTGGYETEGTLEMLRGYVDIYMPDFKYFSNTAAVKYSRAHDYREIVMKALDTMYEQVGPPVFDERGIMQRGMIIRHLMLPGLLGDTVKIINYINKRFGENVWFSLMSQYTPMRENKDNPELNHRIDMEKYRAAEMLCERLGMSNVFLQEETAADESFIPEFSDKKR